MVEKKVHGKKGFSDFTCFRCTVIIIHCYNEDIINDHSYPNAPPHGTLSNYSYSDIPQHLHSIKIVADCWIAVGTVVAAADSSYPFVDLPHSRRKVRTGITEDKSILKINARGEENQYRCSTGRLRTFISVDLQHYLSIHTLYVCESSRDIVQ